MLRIQRRSAQELFRSKADSDSARQTHADKNKIDWFNWHTNRIPVATP